MENQGVFWKMRLFRTQLFPCKLSALGIKLSPYYVYQEGIFGQTPKVFADQFKAYETCFLGVQDMNELHCIDGRQNSEKMLSDRLKKGNKCFALKRDDNIVGFTWCDFDMFTYPPTREFRLKNNESYLFDAYILKAYRGHQLAPFMRYRCYQELQKLGRNVLYSYSDYFNTPANRFKVKIDARLLRLCLYIQLFEKTNWNLTLKNYSRRVKGEIN